MLKRYDSKIGYSHFRQLELAIRSNDIESMKQGINPMNVNAIRDLFGNSLLHYAVSNSKPEVCKFLIDLGADVHSKNKSDTTPLLMASYGSEFSIIKMLVEAGADVNVGQKPLLLRGYIPSSYSN